MVVLPVYITRINSRKDRSWAITIETNELTPEQLAGLAVMQNTYGVMAFKESELTYEETTALDSIEATLPAGKSPSQRLRNVLYKHFLNNPEGFSKFEDYYAFRMERLIKILIDKLEQ